jgi:predicted HAD superfamily Cof-like phosphohydrolase
MASGEREHAAALRPGQSAADQPPLPGPTGVDAGTGMGFRGGWAGVLADQAAAGRPPTGGGTRSVIPGSQLSEAMRCVVCFHEAFGLPRASVPGTGIPAELAKLRVDLLMEETGEFADATAKGDIVGIADALADIVYVAYGAAVTYGIDLDAALREVHRSNMSKLDDQGRPVYREDGKVLKSARYTPPDIDGVLSRQSPLPF